MSRRSGGFTLVEMIIVIGLMGLLFIVLAQFFFTSMRLYRTENAELNINMSARMSLDEVDTYVRQAVRVVDAYDIYTTGPQTLILEVQSVDSSTLLIPGAYDTVIFHLVGSSLYREIVPDSASTRLAGVRLVGSNVSSLAFTFDSVNVSEATTVNTELAISENTGREIQNITVSSKAYLRN